MFNRARLLKICIAGIGNFGARSAEHASRLVNRFSNNGHLIETVSQTLPQYNYNSCQLIVINNEQRNFVKAVGSDFKRCYILHVVKITEIMSINELNTDFTLQSYKTRENSNYH